MKKKYFPFIAGAAAFFVSLFIAGVFYNGPFIDESSFAVTVKIGNIFYQICEIYLFPLVSYSINLLFAVFGHPDSGYIGVRAVNALFTAIAVYFLYDIARYFYDDICGEEGSEPAGFISATLFFLSAPVMYVSTIGTYDSMAFMFYIVGLGLMAQGVRNDNVRFMVLGAVFTALAVFTRYMVLVYLPVVVIYSLYASFFRRNFARTVKAFLIPLLLILSAYFIIQRVHVVESISFARSLAKELAGKGSSLEIVINLFLRVWPVAILAVCGLLVLIIKYWRRMTAEKATHILFLVCGSLTLAAYYMIVAKNDFALEKNLYLSVIFISILAGIGIAHFAIVYPVIAHPPVIASPKGVAISLVVFVLITLNSLSIIKIDRMWPDWTPVLGEMRRLGVGNAKEIWCTSKDGAGPGVRGNIGPNAGNVWILYKTFGGSVDVESPWREGSPDNVVKAAGMKNVPLVVGPLTNVDLNEGDIYLGYKILSRVKVKIGPDVYIMGH